MKAFSALVFASVLAASSGAVVVNSQYVTAVNGACQANTGYSLLATVASGQAVATLPAGQVTANGTVCSLSSNNGLLIGCASGWVVDGLTSPTVWAGAFNNAGTLEALTGLTTPPQASVDPTFYQLTTNTSFTCRNPNTTTCNYTCSPSAGCVNTSGSLNVGQTTDSVCNSGYIVSQSETCAVNGTLSAISCLDTATLNTAAQYNAYVAATGVPHSQLPTRCNCNANPVCRAGRNTAETPVCTRCFNDSGCTTSRQVLVGAAGVTCPAATTVSQANACFRNAACSGVVNSAQTCVFAGLTAPCPNCDDSKKGLLGLLGLLGLIPLLLCSLLLCCLLLACRRSKKGAPQHIGTFDQPAAVHMEVPVTHCGPMVGSVAPGFGPGPVCGPGPVVGPTVF